MTTQKNQKSLQDENTQKRFEFTFNEFTENDGGWYERRLLHRELQLTAAAIENKEALSLSEIKSLSTRNMIAQERIEAVIFERCSDPEALRDYLNTLPASKLWSFIFETATKIGFLNPVDPN